MKLTLERQIPLVFAIAILFLVIVGFFAFRSMDSLNEALKREKYTEQVLLQLDETLILMINAETGARGFAITADESFLKPYNEARQKIDGDLNSLRGLIADNPNQTERFKKLENLIAERLAQLKQVIDARRTQSLESAKELIASGKGRDLMNETRLLIKDMKDEESSLLARRESDIAGNLKTTYRTLYLAVIAGILSLGLANLAIFREIGKRRKAENDLRNSNKDLENQVEERTHALQQTNQELTKSEQFSRSIFESSPDCVKILELDGTLHSMNNSGLCVLEIDDFATYAGKQWIDFWEGEENEMAYQAVKSASEGKSASFQGFCRTAKGKMKWWDVSVAPILDGDGKPVRLISTSRDISDRREAEIEREKLLINEQVARRDAEIANRMRDEFLATVSHELRAPLNSILGWGRLLEKGNLDETMSQKALETIVRNAEAQNRLIEDLLDVSRIISGKLRLEIDTIKPIFFVESAMETVRPAAEAKGIALEIIEDSGVSHISGDPNRLQQVIWNLISNAIKFTPNSGKVSVEINRTNGAVDIKVKDTGIGIKEEFLPQVFDRFTQADASSIRKFGGLGLGLAIVRHIIEMHGGTVHAHSDGENLGSTFTVSLPAIANLREDVKPEEIILKNPSKLSLDGLLILVVDDEDDTRQLLVQSLTFYGATVITAKSATEGLIEIIDKNPDVLVSDIGMPGEDGYSLIRKTRALSDERQKNVKAIALTAFTRAQDRMRALSAGYQNHVSKPVEPDELATVIASLTGRLQVDLA